MESSSNLPRYCRWALFFALLLTAPSLWVGLQLDDYFHWGLVTQQNPVLHINSPASLYGLFSFLDGDPGRVLDLTNLGLLPWWTNPEVKYAFWRPLTEFTHGVDYGLWPQLPWLMHLHSLLYFALLLWVTFRLFGQIQGKGRALWWAVFLFALSYGHGVPVGWIANRNALLASLFLVLTLHFHHQWRVNDRGILDLRAVLLFVAGLLCGEMAVSTGCYILAYVLFLDNGPWKDRLASLLPYALAGLIWLGVRAMLGYGANGSGHYIDPMTTPHLFVQMLGLRGLDLLGGLFFAVPPELGSALPPARRLVYGLLFVVLLALSWPLLRQDRRARFWLVGALLCLLPVASTVAHSRLLLAASIGAAGFLGLWLEAWREGRLLRVSGLRQATAALAGLLIALNLGVSALLLPVEAVSMRLAGDGMINRGALSWNLPDDPKSTTPILLNPPLSSAGGYINGVRAYRGMPVAAKTWLLASGTRPLTMTVIGNRAFDLASEQGLYDPVQEGLLRGPQAPLAEGDSMRLSGMIVTVMDARDGVPTRARFQFAQPLDSGAYRFYHWAGGQILDCALPLKGASVVVRLDSIDCATPAPVSP
ncbi:MAG TPA: hypothetical protein VM553_20000 [Dongiaceae bacterium]|nr:hypothetical protein [Dongiaceae bacterium]